MMLIGAHVSPTDPLEGAEVRKADLVQFFLSNPQSWKIPRERADAAELRGSGLPIYVHAPYLINVASANNRVRIPSRKMLQQTCDTAASIGARAVIVHGGHLTEEEDAQEGFGRWRRTFEQLETDVPVYLENTAGGTNAMTRHFDTIARLWEHVGDFGVGFCLDTCHAHAAGEDVAGSVARMRALIGRVDLVHCNDSRDPPGCGRDRHEHLGEGQIDPDALLAVVREADVPVVCETPGPAEAQAADIAWLRDRL